VDEAPQGLKRNQLYLKALRDTANAPAVLSGTALTPRRFLLELPERIAKLDIPEFTGAFIAQFTNDSVDPEQMDKWLSQWQASFDAIKGQKEIPVNLVPTRRNYYEKAITVMAPDHPAAALWLLLNTWTEIAALLPKTEPLYKEYQACMRTLELDSKGIPGRLASLDTLIDMVENNIDRWQEENA
jgi:hypothetical protein